MNSVSPSLLSTVCYLTSIPPRFALDLVEVFFQIVHTRIPILNPEQFRSRLQLQTSTPLANIPPLHPALVAVILAWGTKFSEHPLLIADRTRPNGQSLMAKTLIDRARDLAEALKVHRIPSSEHVVIALLIEPLQSRESQWCFPTTKNSSMPVRESGRPLW